MLQLTSWELHVSGPALIESSSNVGRSAEKSITTRNASYWLTVNRRMTNYSAKIRSSVATLKELATESNSIAVLTSVDGKLDSIPVIVSKNSSDF